MPLSQEVINARIDVRVARLRLLAARTAAAVFNRDAPPPPLLLQEDQYGGPHFMLARPSSKPRPD
jgi:hypothetical protein